jgi:hypothetical protein
MHQAPKNSEGSTRKRGRVFEIRIVENLDRLALELENEEIKLKLPVDWGVR